MIKQNPATSLWPIGHVAAECGRTVSEIDAVMEANGFEPIMWIQGVAMISVAQMIALANILKRQEEAASAAPGKPQQPPTRLN